MDERRQSVRDALSDRLTMSELGARYGVSRRIGSKWLSHFVVKQLRFHTRLLYLANAMVDQHIGLEDTDDGTWAIHFNGFLLATFDERHYLITG